MIYALIVLIGFAYMFLFQESLQAYYVNPKHKIQSIIYLLLFAPAFAIYGIGVVIINLVLAVLGTLFAPSALIKRTHKNIFYMDIYFTDEFVYIWVKSYFEEAKVVGELSDMYNGYKFYLVPCINSVASYIRILESDPETKDIGEKTKKRFINDFKNGVDVTQWVVDNIVFLGAKCD